MPIPACSACRRTVSTSHCSVALRGCSITSAPVDALATHFDIKSEMNDPPMPNTKAKPNRTGRLSPERLMKVFSPSRFTTTPSTSMTARLVSRNNTTRFMIFISVSRGCRPCVTFC